MKYLPNNLICLWHGLLGGVPANWQLCDGTNGTPNLVDLFPHHPDDLTPVGPGPGQPNHTHVLNPIAHYHETTVGSDIEAGIGYRIFTQNENIVGDTDASPNIPPYHALYYLQKISDPPPGTPSGAPQGIITIWNGSVEEIPLEWHYCDGYDGTPNLRGKFIPCSGLLYVVGAVGGVVGHSHFMTANPHNHEIQAGIGITAGTDWDYVSTNTAAPGSSSLSNHLPNYKAMVYMIKV